MMRFYLRFVILPVVVLSAVVMLIHTRSYDDHELRQILFPSDCTSPCFLGIRPKVTRVDEALKILRASGWTERIEQYSSNISVQWNSSSPAWLSKNRLFSGTVFWIEDGLVTRFIVETNLMVGDIHLGLGKPPFQHISLNYFNTYRFLFYSAAYPDEAVNISTSRDCDYQVRTISYFNKVYLNYDLVDKQAAMPPTYHASWLDVIHTICR